MVQTHTEWERPQGTDHLVAGTQPRIPDHSFQAHSAAHQLRSEAPRKKPRLDQGSRARCSPHPEPGGVPPCHSIGSHRQNQATAPACGQLTGLWTTRQDSQPVTVTSACAGRVVSLLAGAFLLFDAVIHVLTIEPVVDSFRELGFSAWQSLPIGVLELACLALYAIPRTSVLGAVLLTGYLGGAVCAHFRAESELFSATLFPVYLGIALWAGLYLRNEKVRALVRGA